MENFKFSLVPFYSIFNFKLEKKFISKIKKLEKYKSLIDFESFFMD
jgi:hypothetical protein